MNFSGKRQNLLVVFVGILIVGGFSPPQGSAEDSPSALDEQGAIDISAGNAHTCAVFGDGTAKCWGHNGYGMLGDGTFTNRWTPVNVAGLENAVSVSAGESHTCALLADGTAKCWGRNFEGQLGDGTTSGRTTPVTVSGLENAISISAGGKHSCALLEDGAAKCWGDNFRGQLGDATTTRRLTPVPVSGIDNGIELSAGAIHTCAVLASGMARCWGNNNAGELGDGTTLQRHAPVNVSGLEDAISITAGNRHTCARLGDDTADCWGFNSNGQLGDGTATVRLTPVTVSGLVGPIDLTAGGAHSCAVLGDGSGQCWGYNGYGSLGDGTTEPQSRYTPVSVVDLSTAVRIDAGYLHTCALLANGVVTCWGHNLYGQLGDGTNTDRPTPVRVAINRAPVAVIGTTSDAECTDGRQTVALDGSGSFDPDDDAISFSWTAAGITFDDPTSATPNASFPLGDTTVTLTVTDTYLASDTATATVRVADTLPPVVSITRPTAGAAYVNDMEIIHEGARIPILALGPLTLVADVEDQCGVVQVDFTSTAGPGSSASAVPYTFLSDPGALASGPVTVTATAIDLGGNTAAAGVDFIQVGVAA